MRTLEEVRTITFYARRQQVPEPELQTRVRQCCAQWQRKAEQHVLAAAEAGQQAVDVLVESEVEFSYLEQLYGNWGYRTAPAGSGAGNSRRTITLKWN